MPTATDLANLVRCAHRVYLDANGDPSEKVPASGFLQLLWENGRAHEETVIAALPITEAPTRCDPSQRASETLQLMRAGTELIYHGLLRSGDLVGEPDLLERVAIPSALGDFSYIPVEIKNAGAFEDDAGERPKESYLAQLSAYAELLEHTQGVRPSTGKIIDSSGKQSVVALATYRPRYDALRARHGRVTSAQEVTRPGWKSSCDVCQWQLRCHRVLLESDDLTMVAGLGETHREKLEALGIRSVSDLARTSAGDVEGKAKGIGATLATSWTRQARVQKAGRHQILARWAPPEQQFEISYDVEEFIPGPFVYLHGLLIRERTGARFGAPDFTPAALGAYQPVCADANDVESAVWARFLDAVKRIEQLGSYLVYVYSSHERTTLKRLAEKYGGSDELERFVARFVDLHEVIRRTMVLPTDSYSLKPVANYAGFRWREETPSGSESMAWWNQYCSDPVAHAALRDRILAYNEDDLRASFAVADWLARVE